MKGVVTKRCAFCSQVSRFHTMRHATAAAAIVLLIAASACAALEVQPSPEDANA